MLLTDERTPCSDQPHLWYSDEPTHQVLARTLCQTCPFMLRCLAETLETEQMMGTLLTGIHGGLTPAQRTVTALKRIG